MSYLAVVYYYGYCRVIETRIDRLVEGSTYFHASLRMGDGEYTANLEPL